MRRWMRPAERDQGLRKEGLSTSERQELARRRRANRHLCVERKIQSSPLPVVHSPWELR